MKITFISLDSSSDPYHVWYIDDIKYEEGDDYHTKISYEIAGATKILDHLKIPYEYEAFNFDLKTDKKELWEYDYQPEKDEKPEPYLKRIRKFMKEVKETQY